MTFSCADLRWMRSIKSSPNCKDENYQIKTDRMTWNEKCKMRNSNPVVVAKHFQYRVETLFKEVEIEKNFDDLMLSSLIFLPIDPHWNQCTLAESVHQVMFLKPLS